MTEALCSWVMVALAGFRLLCDAVPCSMVMSPQRVGAVSQQTRTSATLVLWTPGSFCGVSGIQNLLGMRGRAHYSPPRVNSPERIGAGCQSKIQAITGLHRPA